MRNIIKNRLKKMLSEAESYTTSNPMSGREPHKATHNDLERIIYQVANAKKAYGDEKYFQDAREGDATYLVIINKNGRVTIKTPNRYIGDNEIGGVSTTRKYDNIEIPIKAYSGNKELLQKGDRGRVTGQPRTQSGASDARIKTYVIFGDMIIDKVRANIESERDKYTDKDNTFTGKTDKQKKRKEYIDQREKKRTAQKANKDKTTAFNSEKEKQAYLDKQAKLQKKYAKIKRGR